jgi:hypothetical protein
MRCLPPLLHLKGGDTGTAGWVRSTVKHIVAELDRGGTGTIEVANRLVDVLFLHAVRSFLDENAGTGGSPVYAPRGLTPTCITVLTDAEPDAGKAEIQPHAGKDPKRAAEVEAHRIYPPGPNSLWRVGRRL